MTCGFIQVDHVGEVMHSNVSGAGYILSQALNTNKHQRHFLPLLMPSILICIYTSYFYRATLKKIYSFNVRYAP